jgi:hypothetical protein
MTKVISFLNTYKKQLQHITWDSSGQSRRVCIRKGSQGWGDNLPGSSKKSLFNSQTSPPERIYIEDVIQNYLDKTRRRLQKVISLTKWKPH